MKKSKRWRKELNQLRGMADVPWPQRRFTYPPTFGSTAGAEHVGHCKRPVGEVQVRKARLRRKQTEQVKCGGRVFLRRGTLGKRRVYCESCRARKEQRQLAHRLEQRMSKLGGLTPREQVREERRTTRMLSRLRRVGR